MNNAKAQIIVNAICGILMLLSISTYLLLGLIFSLWHPYWIIIAISAMVCGVISIIVNTTVELKDLKQEQSKQNDVAIQDKEL